MDITLRVTATTEGRTRRVAHNLKTMDVLVDGVKRGVIKQVIHTTTLSQSRTGIIERSSRGMRWVVDTFVDADDKLQFPRGRASLKYDTRREALHQLLFGYLALPGGVELDEAIHNARIVRN